MTTFAKTRAAADYAARHSRSELTRARAAVLTARLGACEDIPAGAGFRRELRTGRRYDVRASRPRRSPDIGYRSSLGNRDAQCLNMA
jgi:hypothetical protein